MKSILKKPFLKHAIFMTFVYANGYKRYQKMLREAKVKKRSKYADG